MSARWLLKTEPSDYSWADLERDKRTIWDGVGNNLALKNMRAMKRGDRAFLYHTGNERAVIGTVKVIKGAYPDPNRDDPKRIVVDVSADRRLGRPIPLKELRKIGSLKGWDLLRIPRLSVVPVSETQWKTVLGLEGV